jgi:hypothetical protein
MSVSHWPTQSKTEMVVLADGGTSLQTASSFNDVTQPSRRLQPT